LNDEDKIAEANARFFQSDVRVGDSALTSQSDLPFNGVDLHNQREFESVFPKILQSFMTEVNFTKKMDDVFDLLLRVSKPLGMELIVYEYTPDQDDPDSRVFTRSNLPTAMVRLEKWMGLSNKAAYGRHHCRHKWTPGVSGYGFSDMYGDFPAYQRKMKMASIVPGVITGIGVPLRSPDPKSRAGISFSGKLTPDECLGVVREHGAVLTTIAWAAHIRILQHMNEKRGVSAPLTSKQLLYLDLLSQGTLDKEIAYEMGVSVSAVRKHQAAVCKKLGVTRRAELAPEAIRRGLISKPEFDLSVGPEGMWDVTISAGSPGGNDKPEKS
jgi:DNA-binding CsgD family transcriptional regulator